MVVPEEDAGLTPDRVIQEYGPRVYNLARRILTNEADAEDVAQDVLLQVVRKLGSFRGEAALPTWLHRVTVNTALDHRRKWATRERHHAHETAPDELEPANLPGPARRWSLPPDQGLLERKTQQLIETAIARLPESYRDVFVLADVEGLGNAEIAGLLSLKVPAVKSRLHRARLMMRQSLAPHFEEAAP